MPDLSIIIVNYRSRGLVKTCLQGIERSRLSLSYEVIVVDNGSGDDCLEMVRENFPQVRTVRLPENRGLAAGNNAGLRVAKGNFFLFINPDIAVFEGAIERMVEFMHQHPRVAMIGPKLINPDSTIQLSVYRFPKLLVPVYRRTPLGRLPWARKQLSRYIMGEWDHNDVRTVDWILGACMLVRRQAYEAVGEMDERFFLYFEDVDWCRRFWAAGYQVCYFPDAHLVHYHRRLSAESPGMSGIFTMATRIHIQSWFNYFTKYFGKKMPRTENQLIVSSSDEK